MIAGYIGIAAVVAIAATGIYAWDADKALKREHDRAEAAVMQRDQFAKGLAQCRLDIAERNRVLIDAAKLPEIRKRLCAQRTPDDGCCKPEPAECKP